MPGHPGASFLLQRAKSAGPSLRLKSAMPSKDVTLQRQPTIVMYADKNRPLQNAEQPVTLLPSMNSNPGSQQDISEKFSHQPTLIQTQRDIYGNNLRFQSSSFRYNPRQQAEYEELTPLVMYRDALRRNLTTPNRAGLGTPRMHYGRQGGAWRHIKQTNTHSNANFLFIDGTVRVDDSIKFPIDQYGYPPMDHPQHMFASQSNLDLSNKMTGSLDTMTWSATDELHKRPSLSRYSNRYEHHAKDGFVYWPRDLSYQKPKSKTTSTGTYKTWLGLSDAILKI